MVVPPFEGAPLCEVGHKFLGGAGRVVTFPPPWSVGCAPGGAGGESRPFPLSTASGPSGPAGVGTVHSSYHAPELLHLGLGEYPRKMGVQGAGGMEAGRRSRSCRLRPPPGGSLVTFCPGRK